MKLLLVDPHFVFVEFVGELAGVDAFLHSRSLLESVVSASTRAVLT
ncbi:hypothetical protein OOZ51_19645 [Arthrobacter sp. MI7-26]|nr:hypothetical protein [Arthrobacter sp. MI7-26]MCX2750004.1 hypothetical protein [Arthrobacter sp. MI7-26]